MHDPEHVQDNVKSTVAGRLVRRGPILVLVDGGRKISQTEADEALSRVRERGTED